LEHEDDTPDWSNEVKRTTNMSNILEIRDRVQRYLAKLVRFEVRENGSMTFRNGSSRFFISLVEHQKAVTIHIFCPLVLNVPASNELFRYVALHADDYTFGHLSVSETDDGHRIDLTHVLLGDFLDEEELTWSVGAMAGTADDIDDKLAAQFGGHVFHES
jgi:hypothetical protein